MKIERRLTKAGADTYADLEFTTTTSEIRNPDGTVVFKLDDVEVPLGWSQVASDVIAQKYFRKAGVPAHSGLTHAFTNSCFYVISRELG